MATQKNKKTIKPAVKAPVSSDNLQITSQSSSMAGSTYGHNKWGYRPGYLGIRRMEKNRRQIQTILDDITSIIPVYDWRLLISVSRQVLLSNGLLKGALEAKASYTVGSAFDPEYHGADEAWGQQAMKWIKEEWYPNCEIRGILDFKDIQYQKSMGMDVSGDIFRVLTKKKDGFPAIQLIQAHRVGQRSPGDLIESGEYAGYRIENGVVCDADTGEVVGYNVLGESLSDDKIIPKQSMAHLIDPIFSDQFRGLPAAVAGLRDLVMSLKTDENEEDFVEMMSRLTFIEHNPTGEAGPNWGGGSDDLNPNVSATDGNTLKMLDLYSGIAKVFQSGTDSKIEAFNPGDRPSESFDRFADRRYRSICNGIGWPYELAWKLDALTSVGVHSVEQRARMAIDDRQSKIIPSAINEIRWAIANAIELKLLPFNVDWRSWGVSIPPKYSLNPTKAADSRRQDLDKGLTTVGRILRDEGIQGGEAQLYKERARSIALRKQIRDEVELEFDQEITDWEMAAAPAGVSIGIVAPLPENEGKEDETKNPNDKEPTK